MGTPFLLGFSIDQFRANFAAAGQRNYLFYVQMNIPNVVNSLIASAAGSVGTAVAGAVVGAAGGAVAAAVVNAINPGSKPTYLVRSTTIPGKTVEKKEIGWQGYKMPFGGTTTHEDWQVTFMVDADAIIYKQLVAWSNMVHNPSTNMHGLPSVYMMDQNAQLLRGDGLTSSLDIKFYGAWPQNVGSLELNYDNTDIATFQCTFAYVRHSYE